MERVSRRSGRRDAGLAKKARGQAKKPTNAKLTDSITTASTASTLALTLGERALSSVCAVCTFIYTLDSMWLKAFPNARVTRIENAGHFIQEDAHAEVIAELLRVL